MSKYNICSNRISPTRECMTSAPLTIIVTIFPFILLVLFDGMLTYHLFLSITCLFSAFFARDRPRLPVWSELCSRFSHAPDYWWRRCTSPWGQKNSSEAHMPAIQSVLTTPTTMGATGFGEGPPEPTSESGSENSSGPLPTPFLPMAPPKATSRGRLPRVPEGTFTAPTAASPHALLGTSATAATTAYSTADFETVAQWASFGHVWNALVRSRLITHCLRRRDGDMH